MPQGNEFLSSTFKKVGVLFCIAGAVSFVSACAGFMPGLAFWIGFKLIGFGTLAAAIGSAFAGWNKNTHGIVFAYFILASIANFIGIGALWIGFANVGVLAKSGYDVSGSPLYVASASLGWLLVVIGAAAVTYALFLFTREPSYFKPRT